MAGCFGNHWADKIMEQQLYAHLREEEELLDEESEDEKNEIWEEREFRWNENLDLEEMSISDADPGL